MTDHATRPPFYGVRRVAEWPESIVNNDRRPCTLFGLIVLSVNVTCVRVCATNDRATNNEYAGGGRSYTVTSRVVASNRGYRVTVVIIGGGVVEKREVDNLGASPDDAVRG